MPIPSTSHLIIPSILAGSVQEALKKTLQRMTLEEGLMEWAELKKRSKLGRSSNTFRAGKITTGPFLSPC